MGPWMITLLRMVVVPILSKIADALVAKAAATPEDTTDDILAGAFKVVVDALKTDDIIDLITKK